MTGHDERAAEMADGPDAGPPPPSVDEFLAEAAELADEDRRDRIDRLVSQLVRHGARQVVQQRFRDAVADRDRRWMLAKDWDALAVEARAEWKAEQEAAEDRAHAARIEAARQARERERERAATEPARPPEDGAQLLDAVSAALARYVVFPDYHARVASVLWAAHTHVFDVFESTPRLSIHSPEPQCGKTRLMEILELLSARKLRTVNATPAAIFRKIDQEPPSLFLDEADAIFGKDAPPESEALRGLINAGHRPGNPVLRTVGEGSSLEVREFQTFCPCAIAGIGIADLKQLATVIDRSVVIRLRRRAPGEKVRPFRTRRDEPGLLALGRRLGAWVEAHRAGLTAAIPDMPDGIEDRPADVWEPLIAIADAAGGEWPQRARDACVRMVHGTAAAAKQSTSVRLLADIRAVWVDLKKPALNPPPGTNDADISILSSELIERLCAPEESPWADYFGKRISPRQLSGLLAGYDVQSQNIKQPDGKVPKCYRWPAFFDPWARYLPPLEGTHRGDAATGATSATSPESACAAELFAVADTRGTAATHPLPAAGSGWVADGPSASATAKPPVPQRVSKPVAAVAAVAGPYRGSANHFHTEEFS